MLNFKIITDKKIWEKFLLASDQVTFLQSWNWGMFHENLGHKIFRIGIYQQQKLIGLILAIKICAKRGTYLEIPGGPILNWQKQTVIDQVFNYLKSLAKKEKAVFIRIRPNIIITPKLNLVKAPMHLHAENTWVLDLNKTPEQLLAGMRKNTRYSIKKAEKLGVTVIESTAQKDIDKLYQLQLAVVSRQHFTPFSYQYLLTQFQAFVKDGQIKIFKAIYQEKILAISFIIFYGDEAVYHYSGSSDELRQIPASYALQWQAILTAKQLGFKRYNFWGIASNNNPRHRFAGVTLFKIGFGGRGINYFPAHDLIVNHWLYWPTYIFEALRKKLRRL